MLVTHEKPVLVVGPTGTGKSTYINEYLMHKCDKTLYKPTFMNFSSQTKTYETKNIIRSKLEKQGKDVYGAPTGQKCVCFVDIH